MPPWSTCGDHFGRVFHILSRANGEKGINTLHVQLDYFVRQRFFVRYGLNIGQVSFQGRCSLGVDCFFIHARGEIIPDFLLDCRTISLGRTRLQYVPKNFLIALVKLVETSPGRLVRRDGVIDEPVTARVLVEVVARICLRVEGFGVEALLREKAAPGKGTHHEESKGMHRDHVLDELSLLNVTFSAFGTGCASSGLRGFAVAITDGAQGCEDLHRGCAPVQHIKMNTRGAALQQFDTLRRRVRHAQLFDGLRVITPAVEFCRESERQRGAAGHGNRPTWAAFVIGIIPASMGTVIPCARALSDKFKIAAIIEEKLRNPEMTPRHPPCV